MALIEKHHRRDDPRLPSIAALARGASVSPVTMWKAVRELAASGLLSVADKPGVYLGRRIPPAENGAPAPGHHTQGRPRPRWQAVERPCLPAGPLVLVRKIHRGQTTY